MDMDMDMDMAHSHPTAPTSLHHRYVDGELISHKLQPLPPPKTDHKYHVYCSERNPGAAALMKELAETRGFTLNMSGAGLTRSPSMLARSTSVLSKSPAKVKPTKAQSTEKLFVTASADGLLECDNMLLYLTSQTWTRGEASEALAEEVRRAMGLGVHLLLAHESE